MAATQSASAARRQGEAREQARVAITESTTLGADERDAAWALAVKVEPDPAAARAVCLEWRAACQTSPCRLKALGALGRLTGFAPLAKRLIEGEQCVSQAEKAGSPTPCLARALDPTEDEVFASRLAFVKALGERDPQRRAAALRHVETSCRSAPGCLSVRRAILAKLAAAAAEADDAEGVVKAWLKEGQVAAALGPPELATWARHTSLDAACVRYEQKAGAGACRKLEKQVTRTWTFRDFSKDSAGQGLRAELVRQVNEHYAPLLQECLSEQAQRMLEGASSDAARYEVHWTVQNDGRVRDAHLRRDLDQTPLARCVRAQFSSWRYPRFEGEFQNVEQSFVVTATARR